MIAKNVFGAAYLWEYGNGLGMRAIKANAEVRAESLRATVEGIREAGITSFSGIAKELNSKKIKTARGGKWHPASVKRLLERLVKE